MSTSTRLTNDTRAELTLARQETLARIERLERSLTRARRRLEALTRVVGE